MPGPLSLEDLLLRARRRELTRLVLDKTVLAAAVGMGGAVALLLAGTQILDWYWILLLAVASLAAALYRLSPSIPSLYALAQRIDRRLKLADALSTAFYFSGHPDPGRQALCERQKRDAETAAQSVDLRAALPWRRPRYTIPAASLALAALALFGVRYLVTGTIDLRPSLLRIAYDTFFSNKSYEAKAQQRPPRANFDPRQAGQVENPQFEANNPPGELNAKDPKDSGNPSGDDTKSADKSSSPDPPDATAKDGGEKGSPDSNQSGEQPPSDNGSNQQADNQKNSGKSGDPSKSSSSQNSSLMDKLRDALANMMDKMKSSSDSQKSQQNAQKGKPGDKQEPGQKAQDAKDAQASKAPSSADQEGQEGQQKQSTDADNSQKASNQSTSQDAKNGIGSQDGEKALREAQELQAMGKISEILGKRAANVSGEVMVEVGHTEQQLKTPWQQQQANHVEAGSEIHRDEVPLAYQQFVEQYFEEVRKTAPGNAPAAPGNAPAAPPHADDPGADAGSRQP